jgi:hypothetical protein
LSVDYDRASRFLAQNVAALAIGGSVANHGYGAASNYMMRRRWDFFIEWLLDASPPRVYDLNRQPGATSPNNLQ